MATMFDLITSENIVSYYNENTKNRQPYIGETLFPNTQQLGLNLEWIKGKRGLPVVLKTSAFDANVIPRGRQGFERLMSRMPFFKESMYIDEELRQKLNIVLQSGNQAMQDMIMNKVFADNKTLLDAASAARERMRMMALTSGVVSLNSNGQSYTYDYNLENKITVTNKWNSYSTSDPIADIRKAQDTIEDKEGVRPTRLLMTRKTWYDLLASEKINKSIYIMTGGGGVVNDRILNEFLMQELGVLVVLNNKKHINEAGIVTPYVPDDTVSLFPEGTLGRTVFGTTPEQSDLLSNASSNVTITDTGVAVTTMYSEDPVKVEAKVSQICLPSFEAVDQVAILSV